MTETYCWPDISVEYSTRIERGEARGVSNEVLDAVSRALQLDEAEHAHLLGPPREPRPSTSPDIRIAAGSS